MWIVLLIGVLVLVAIWFWLTQPLFIRSSNTSPRRADPARLQTLVHKLSTDFHPRDSDHTDNLDRTAAFIRDELLKTGATVLEQLYRVEGRSYRNVIARFGPESAERLVIGAHYDTAGPLPGADDNASGVAGLIVLAELLGKQPPPIRVELVAFSLEEPPFFGTTGMGSSVHAESLRKENVKVRAMISLEMIGYFSDAPGSQNFPASILKAFYPSTGNYIAVVGRISDGLLVRRVKGSMSGAATLPVHSINAPSFLPGVDFSDQLNYWRLGYSGVMITDTAFYRNLNYHTEHDTAEKLDYNRMAMVVDGAYAAVVDLSK
jgi:Zn-dependent M28 family amino/carboxypeptidase